MSDTPVLSGESACGPIAVIHTDVALSGRDGRFAFGSMRDGTYFVEVRIEGQDVRVTSKAIAFAGKDTVDCDIRVPEKQ